MENLLPSKLGLVKRSGEEDKLSIKNFNFGDRYLKILSDGVTNSPNIKKFHFGNNRISEKGAHFIIGKLNQQIQEIDLKSNRIGKQGCEQLALTLQQSWTQIALINVEDNNLGDLPVILLLKAMLKNKVLQSLNISKNRLTDQVHSLFNLCVIRSLLSSKKHS
jgi:hypothetical protein